MRAENRSLKCPAHYKVAACYIVVFQRIWRHKFQLLHQHYYISNGDRGGRIVALNIRGGDATSLIFIKPSDFISSIFPFFSRVVVINLAYFSNLRV